MTQQKRRALFSVSDKTGVVELARGLAELGFELIASRGTAKELAEAGLTVTDVASLTDFPPILEHRVVTLHPAVHAGILAKRRDPGHEADLREHEIEPFDLVVVNLYPFGSDPGIELIDIGGPAMVRAAAKNHEFVGVVVDPLDYRHVLWELQGNDGELHPDTRRALARKAFAHTAAYDAAIVGWMDQTGPDALGLPESVHLSANQAALDLRYGENPHQRAKLYRLSGQSPWWADMVQHGGVPLSYLNVADADAAWLLAHDLARTFGQPAAVIVKHANACGAAIAGTAPQAYQRAYECDTRSAFGGIVAITEVVDGATADCIVAAAQADVIIAPGYAPGVVNKLLRKRKNTRILEAPAPMRDRLHIRQVTGGLLVQDQHNFRRGGRQVVTERSPTLEEWSDVELAWRVCGWTKSNAIVLAKDGTAWGIGAGQQNRVESGQLAASKADGRAAGGACASDAFYPFPDGIDVAAAAGVAVIIQPGGSIRDAECIARANEHGLAMVFTSERHFFH